MGTQSHCTDSARPKGSGLVSGALLLLLTGLVLLVHGYHPWAEDGGIYAAAVKYKLDPQLFRADAAFVAEPGRFSVFPTALALLCRTLHLPVSVLLLSLYVGSAALMLWAVRRLAGLLLHGEPAQWFATTTVAAVWTMPIAGTSLLLMDPYVTARSLAVPLVVVAIGEQLEGTGGRARWVRCALCLGLAGVLHPLMAGYGAFLCGTVWLAVRGARPRTWALVGAGTLLFAMFVQALGPAESEVARAAVFSRYYWFLWQWRWYELIGVLAPLAFFVGLLRWPARAVTPAGLVCCRAALFAGCAALTVALLFGREALAHHAVARLQPLRLFLFLYVPFLLLLSGLLFRRGIKAAALALLVGTATGMFAVARATFPGVTHLEIPGRATNSPWLQAFLWVRGHTPVDAVFALDAGYIQAPGEDAEVFRPVAERSVLADYSKDGGEASLEPALAARWQRDMQATQRLDRQRDDTRTRTLVGLGATWVILATGTPTRSLCPYRNTVVKVCRLLR